MNWPLYSPTTAITFVHHIHQSISNSDDFANIHINLANAATYSEDGILKEVSQRIPDWMLSQGFPDLFPFGKGDTTNGRCRQTFCKPPLICFCGNQHAPPPHDTDPWQCLCKRSAEWLTVEALKFALQSDDDRIIKNVLYFASTVPGTRQYLRFKADKATSFVKYV